MQERLKLVRRRAELREQVKTFAEEDDRCEHWKNRIDFLTRAVNDLSSQLFKVRRKQFRQKQAKLTQELSDAWQSRDLSKCHKIARLIAARGQGVKRRQFNIMTSCIPSAAEWEQTLSLPGKQGGLLATKIDWDLELETYYIWTDKQIFEKMLLEHIKPLHLALGSWHLELGTWHWN